MSTARTVRAYGLWPSPIGPDVILGGARLGDVAWDDETGQLVWSEASRGHGTLFAVQVPLEPGAGCEAPRQLTTTLNVRGRLGYGGGEFTVARGHVFFAADGGRLYRQSLEADDATPITPPFGSAAAPAVHPSGRFVAYVHSVEDVDRIALVDSEGAGWPHILAQGADFYMHPAWHPDGSRFAYVAWQHPDMPWDGATLHVARFDADGPGGPRLVDDTVVAGRSGGGPAGDGISVMQPGFSPDGRFLVYISDASGHWQLYAYDGAANEHIQLTDAPFEHGVPPWVQGQRTYAFAPDGRSLYYIRNEKGWHRLMQCTLYDGQGRVRPRSVDMGGHGAEYAVLSQIAVRNRGEGERARAGVEPGPVHIAFLGTGPKTPPRVVVAEVDRAPSSGLVKRFHVLRRSQAENFPPGLLSRPETVSWPAPDGTEVYGLYYPPTHPQMTAPGGLPPAVISIHGGPTSQSLPEFNGKAQFFTSRGYAYVEPNYRGSTGFGRAYRNMLRGRWGVLDVEDAVGAGRWLTETGRADEGRLVIMGGSAGGYTALRALAEAPGFFKAAINMYGVADLFGLATDTHKFERRYTDQLVGPLPEAAAVYRERSPVFHPDKINDPVAVFQGTEDAVVPKSQSDAIVDALRRRGVPCEYYVFEGEGHGWRQPATVRAVFDAIERFLQRYVLFA